MFLYKQQIPSEVGIRCFENFRLLTRCHTNTLWTIAQPQNTIPEPIKTLVMMAGVEWNCIKVYKITAEKKKSKIKKIISKIIVHLYNCFMVHGHEWFCDPLDVYYEIQITQFNRGNCF